MRSSSKKKQNRLVIELPLPDRRLGGNTRVHHMALYRIRKQHKGLAGMMTKQVMLAAQDKDFNFAGYALEFFYTLNRRRDVDNLVTATKAYLDGVSAALGQDDSAWELFGAKITLEKSSHPRLEITMKKDK